MSTLYYFKCTSLMLATCLLMLLQPSQVMGQEKVSLIEPAKPHGGFVFNNGGEFPGAKGQAKVIETDAGKALELSGDLSGGGNYVQITKQIADIDPMYLSFEAKVIGCRGVTLRLIDQTGQCHQIALLIKDTDDWQKIALPIHSFFENMSKSTAVDSVKKYERWGGAKDGKWHGPAKLIAILGSHPTTTQKQYSIAVRDLYMLHDPTAKSQSITENASNATAKPGKVQWHNMTLNIGDVSNLSTYIVGDKTSSKASVQKDEAGKEYVRLDMHVQNKGTYVGAAMNFDATPVNEVQAIELEMRTKALKHFSMRLSDGTGQTHQTKRLNVQSDGQWHTYTFPIEKVSGGETWGGSKDRKWYDPIKGFAFAIGNDALSDKDAQIDLRRLSIKGVGSAGRLLKPVWLSLPLLIEDFSEISTFAVGKGNQAKATVNDIKSDKSFVQVNYTFGGNGYAGAVRKFSDSPINNIHAVQLTLRTSTVQKIGTQLLDGTGQTHQAKGLALIPDGQWHTYTFPISKLVGAESWGGAKDRRWHYPLTQININCGSHEAQTKSTLDIQEIKVLGVSFDPKLNTPEAVEIDFEQTNILADWDTSTKTAQRVTGIGFDKSAALQIKRSETQALDTEPFAYSPTFPAGKGWWKVSGVFGSDLYSPDNSFACTTSLQCLDITGKQLQVIEFDRSTKQTNLKSVSREIRLPDGTISARFMIHMRKTYGQYTVDNLTLKFVKPVDNTEDLVERIVVRSDVLGNLFEPGDTLKLDVNLMTKRPLSDVQRQIAWQVTDYWGVEQTSLSTLNLQKSGRNGEGNFEYKGAIDLSHFNADVGKYYELQLTALRDAPRAYKDYRSFAVLPKADTHQYNWREIPFSSRNWDNRIGEYIDLSSRLGLPIIGAWTGWDTKPPYKVQLPGVERILGHNVAVMGGTPMGAIENHRGDWQKIDETCLREGITNLFKSINQKQLVITMGNEPPDNFQRASENLWAYKAMYEAAKMANPDVTMVGTSVGPSEAYFKAGVHQYCDVVDFHVYESHQRIREVFKRYDRLFDEYGHRKPIWSTEIGLNSQGVPRRDVASSLVKKFSIFFASGGENISWFGLLYPDPSGKSSGSSGDSHNVFDCRYRTYSPRLDAIAYYNMVNSISIKKFVTEQKYSNDVEAYLFADKDGNQLQILWTDKDSKTVFVPLESVNEVSVTYIDGLVRQMHAGGTGLTLRVTQDPILLKYKSASTLLASALPQPKVAITNLPNALVMGGQVQLVTNNTLSGSQVSLEMPAQWGSDVTAVDGKLKMQVPANSSARHVPLSVQQHDDQGRLCGELREVLPIIGRIAMEVRPTLVDDKPAVSLKVANNGYEPQAISWNAVVSSSLTMKKGGVNWARDAGPANNNFTGDTSGKLTLGALKTQQIILPVKQVNPMQIDRVVVSVKDPQDREIQIQRFVSAFCGVPRAESLIILDGQFNEGDWSKAKVQLVNHKDQYHTLQKERQWEGLDDLSARIRFLWDKNNLYIGIQATDDIHSTPKKDGNLWAQDGVQLMIDPARGSSQQGGKYDLVMGEDVNGKAYAWCHLSADPSLPTGPMPDIKVAVKRDETNKTTNYEIAIPWSQISPFKPGVGENLGIAVALNEDDGKGRVSFLSWFADVHAKQTDGVADLILLP